MVILLTQELNRHYTRGQIKIYCQGWRRAPAPSAVIPRGPEVRQAGRAPPDLWLACVSKELEYPQCLNPQEVWRKDHQGQNLGTFANHVRTPFELLEVKHVIKVYSTSSELWRSARFRSPRSPRPKDSQFGIEVDRTHF
ncbi:hypothetical protein PGT21_025378 [Puccinia graminis f. sp. tritici]|uniref:Uncharacterized protein n=1 Tax=Puccinia graminis f. sp. tritici TaxID=56615 RepID=A0A5B0MFN0_PUCGR|nr:hypothetical protein PGT21_025378 [Puccinia graminis f. sp. tritici]